ncbi:Rieske (2Fe-2S) protein [Lichenifustis flavocetrariae]|uniref:Rieske 2Fe-2S domain-containing protein n=1 Tax=Lichenifustis flavocetrariae TaxID=2949735 RepID=A0AA42CHR4_9HYPH|nr:Rieske 2Fe-2S domain-containing protein [Lichenifustis flavocetrariae]MCW6507818.1 Rieske 2Fe-2S domain-containing protein [Lichenifustis flavocetrariae]
MAEHFVCKSDELPDGQVRIMTHGSLEIGVIRHGDAYYAYRNLCPHQGGPACEGIRLPQVEDRIVGDLFVGQCFDENDMHIVCPWHGYEFHLSTGEHVIDSRLKLRKFDVVAREGGVYVDI